MNFSVESKHTHTHTGLIHKNAGIFACYTINSDIKKYTKVTSELTFLRKLKHHRKSMLDGKLQHWLITFTATNFMSHETFISQSSTVIFFLIVGKVKPPPNIWNCCINKTTD